MSSAIKTPAFQAKAGNIQNEDGSSIYSGGEWSFKNASAVTGFHVDADGKAGIGTSSPQQRLHVAGNIQLGAASFPSIKYTDNANDIKAEIYYGVGGNDLNLLNIKSGPVVFSTANTERMRIDANGKIGIGVTGTIPQQLSLTGGIGFANVNASDKKLYAPTDGCLEWLTQAAAGTPFFAVSNNGTQNVRIYSTGTIYAQNTSIQPISSDVELKQDIVNYNKGLTEVLALKPRYFAYKTEPEKVLAGFIAQEVNEALPGALIETIDGNKSYQVDWNPLLVKAIQELSAKNEALEARLAALESK